MTELSCTRIVLECLWIIYFLTVTVPGVKKKKNKIKLEREGQNQTHESISSVRSVKVDV